MPIQLVPTLNANPQVPLLAVTDGEVQAAKTVGAVRLTASVLLLASIAPPMLIWLLLADAEVSTVLLVPIRMLPAPVISVVDPTSLPMMVFCVPNVIDFPA